MLLSALSCISVPAGIFFGQLGLRGRFIDASRAENVTVGLQWLGMGLLPLLLLGLWSWGWRRWEAARARRAEDG